MTILLLSTCVLLLRPTPSNQFTEVLATIIHVGMYLAEGPKHEGGDRLTHVHTLS